VEIVAEADPEAGDKKIDLRTQAIGPSPDEEEDVEGLDEELLRRDRKRCLTPAKNSLGPEFFGRLGILLSGTAVIFLTGLMLGPR